MASTFDADEIITASGIAAGFKLWGFVVVRPIEGERNWVVVTDLVLNAAVTWKSSNLPNKFLGNQLNGSIDMKLLFSMFLKETLHLLLLTVLLPDAV